MSGRRIHTDKYMPGRREFFRQLLGLAAVPLVAAGAGCDVRDKYAHITGGIVGANHKTGHLLRGANNFPDPAETITTDVLIVGGGISGLSAKRWLAMHGVTDVLLLEMDGNVGGNSVSGANSISAYPWAAHYLPVPDVANTELLDFLRSINTITGFAENGLPVYNEYHLCHDPEERLYINGHWQEGLVPKFGISAEDDRQISRFFAEVESYKRAKGADGRYLFRIPVDMSSADEACRLLDKIPFEQYLAEKGYTSRYLQWYLEYCCKDDYGSGLKDTSAWAGLHYFASRRGQAVNAHSSGVLTWPEGNAFLMSNLRAQAPQGIKTNMLAYKTEINDNGAAVLCYDVAAARSIKINARKVIMAAPQYVNKHLLPEIAVREKLYTQLCYAPWMVANITLSGLPQSGGFPLCWDNVIYGQQSVGYVCANHQDLTHKEDLVITYYLPVTGDAAAARSTIYKRSYKEWQAQVVADLEFAHHGVTAYISNIDVWVWGHGMIRPSPGYIWSAERQEAMQPVGNSIFFAHTDLSGISIFEEGFYQGINAAKQAMQTL